MPGRSVYLSTDSGLQKAVHDALADGLQKANSKAGASVVTDPRTGEILAMVSIPGYDDNLFARGISQSDYQKLLADPGKPLYDRALAGEYPPGSTFKMITGSAGLQEGKITADTQLGCPANLTFGAWTYWDWAHYDSTYTSMRALGMQFFRHDEKRHALIGERTGITYNLGNAIRVKLAEATPITGGLRFELPEEEGWSETQNRGRGRGRPQRRGRP